jgi:hypothetical protein
MKNHWVDEENSMNEQLIRRDVKWGLWAMTDAALDFGPLIHLEWHL